MSIYNVGIVTATDIDEIIKNKKRERRTSKHVLEEEEDEVKEKRDVTKTKSYYMQSHISKLGSLRNYAESSTYVHKILNCTENVPFETSISYERRENSAIRYEFKKHLFPSTKYD